MMSDGEIMATLAIIVSVVSSIVALVNHKKVKSKCCGKQLEMSIDIESTQQTKVSPTATTPESLTIRVPPPLAEIK